MTPHRRNPRCKACAFCKLKDYGRSMECLIRRDPYDQDCQMFVPSQDVRGYVKEVRS